MRLLRAPLVNVPRVKKPRRPIAKVSKKMAAKKQARAKCLDDFFERYGWTGIEDSEAECQLCGFVVSRSSCDFSHKHRASQAGPDTPQNGLALHRLCHTYLHTRRDLENICTDSPANLENGLMVKLPDQLRLDLYRYLGLSHL